MFELTVDDDLIECFLEINVGGNLDGRLVRRGARMVRRSAGC